MKHYAALALGTALLVLGFTVGRVVNKCVTHIPNPAQQAALAKQAKAPYDDVELTNCGSQLEWIQQMRGEKPVYKTPPFVRTW